MQIEQVLENPPTEAVLVFPRRALGIFVLNTKAY